MTVPDPPASDESLLARLQSGDDSALTVLVRRYEKELFSYLQRYLNDRELAEDVFQNVFLQIYRKRDSFDQSRRFKPWLYAIATHQAVDALRRQRRHTRLSLDGFEAANSGEVAGAGADALPANASDPSEAAMKAEERVRLRSAVDSLADHLKPVVVMAYFQGLKYQDIADALDIPVGTVKSRLFVAIQRLQETWGESE